MKDVLVLSAHIDDAECGCGGTIARHLEQGDRVSWHTLIGKGYKVPDGWRWYVLQEEFQEAMLVLGVDNYQLYDFDVDTVEEHIHRLRDQIYRIWKYVDPDVAYIPWSGSRHQDHAVVGKCAEQVSWRSRAEILQYVVPNDYLGFVPNTFSSVSEEHFKKKLEAIQCYASQFLLRPWFSTVLLMNHAKAFSVFSKGKAEEYVEPFLQTRRLVNRTIDEKKRKQIRRAILAFEKMEGLWPPSYLGDAAHQRSLDGRERNTRKLHIKIRFGIPSTYHSGGSIVYDVVDHDTDVEYTVKHYFPNQHFDKSYGWYIEVKK
jgi:LmbE family N-acetylglucosaminyl deacetylase